MADTPSSLVPLPSGAQLVPSHLAMLLAVTSPATLKMPPAYSAGPVPSSNTARANNNACGLLIPLPSEAHTAPSHLAILAASVPPAILQNPPAYHAGPL